MGHSYSEKFLYVCFENAYFYKNYSQLVACDLYFIADLFLLQLQLNAQKATVYCTVTYFTTQLML